MRTINVLILFILFLGLCSCNTETELPSLEDQELLNIAYSDTSIYADDFYIEECEYSTYYINTVSTTSPEENVGHIDRYDLATNDYQQALAWTDSSISYHSGNRLIIVSERETEKYFEFVRTDGQSTVAYRVYKLKYFEPLMNYSNPTDTMGIYNSIMTINKTKEFAEDMFYKGKFRDNIIPGGYSKILNSVNENHSDYFMITIRSMLIVWGDWGVYDVIYVHDNYIKIFKNSGVVLYTRELVKQIFGRQNHYPKPS